MMNATERAAATRQYRFLTKAVRQYERDEHLYGHDHGPEIATAKREAHELNRRFNIDNRQA